MIYILSNDPVECAKLLDDKSLGKMITACADVLRFTYLASIYDPFESGEREWFRVTAIIGDICIDRKHKLYPWSQWARACLANYQLLLAYARACCEEWIYRSVDDYAEQNYPEGYCSNCDMKHEAFTPKKHKHHDAIAWCGENLPDLPKDEMLVTADFPSSNAIELYDEWPLVMPDKYILVKCNYNVINPKHELCLIESYRAYYKAKLKKMLAKENCNCTYSIDDAELLIQGASEFSVCQKCNGKLCIIKVPKFTRREIPAFLGNL